MSFSMHFIHNMYTHARMLLFISNTPFCLYTCIVHSMFYIYFLIATLYQNIMHNSTIMFNSTSYNSSIIRIHTYEGYHPLYIYISIPSTYNIYHNTSIISHLSCILILSLIFLSFHNIRIILTISYIYS